MVHASIDNRHSMLVDFHTIEATGTAEREMTGVLVDGAKPQGFIYGLVGRRSKTGVHFTMAGIVAGD